MFNRRERTEAAGGIAKSESVAEKTSKQAMPRRSLLSRLGFVFGLFSLSYILGASVIYFELPTSTFLRQAFSGAGAWYESRNSRDSSNAQLPTLSVGQIDKPDKTCDGFTLCMYGEDSQAFLVNMRGDIVHKWHIPFSKIWPTPKHVEGYVDDATVYFNDGRLYPNGDLLAVIEGPVTLGNTSNGFGLVKLDKDSNVIWSYSERCHHELDVGDDGTIYALVNEVTNKIPPELEFVPTPCMVDLIDVISPDGKRIKRIRVLEALQESPYAAYLGIFDRPMHKVGSMATSTSTFRQEELRRDLLHMNSIKALRKAQASKFPQFREGQLLISPRNLDIIAVLDPVNEKIVWATRGPWHAQHDPTFLDNGHILLFDNSGSPRGSRVLEFDPQTLALPWSYPGVAGKPFYTQIRGLCQRLPNGNTLIVNSNGGEVFEVTSLNEIVWSCSIGQVTLNSARRYMPDQLQFLKGVQSARP
jgi:hypothetical protein